MIEREFTWDDGMAYWISGVWVRNMFENSRNEERKVLIPECLTSCGRSKDSMPAQGSHTSAVRYNQNESGCSRIDKVLHSLSRASPWGWGEMEIQRKLDYPISLRNLLLLY